MHLGSLPDTTFISVKHSNHLSKAKGFTPISIYSNQTTALSEIPKYSDSNQYKGEIGLGISASAYPQVKQDLINLALKNANWELEKQALSDSKKKKFFLFRSCSKSCSGAE